MALTDRQRVFIAEYAKTGNATLAAKAAGYSPKTAYAQGCRLLKDPLVDSELKKLRVQMLKKNQVTFENTIDELNQALALAMTLAKPSAAVAAIMAKAKLAGLLDKDNFGEVDETPLEIRIVE